MSKIVSIDVGIRNLSFCFFEENKILKWDNIDLTEREKTCCSFPACQKAVKYTKMDQTWCLKHSKMQPYMVPQKELTKSAISKTKLPGLKALLEKYKINVSGTRDVLSTALLQYADKNCFEPINKVSAVHLNLVTIGRNIQHKLDAIFGDDPVDRVIIENQIGPLASKMKTVQGMLAQYFIMKNNAIQIEFISSANKLKDVGVDTTALEYKDRKKASIQVCLDQIPLEWKPFFQSHKKKDDLADCFLQGLWYLNKKALVI